MIHIDRLSKQFRVYASKFAMVKGAFGLARKGSDYEIFTALKDISLDIQRGEIHGIIGVNGAGKSTLLKILVGVMDASSGSFKVGGTVASLLELGTGFHSELTGRENVYINASLLGFTKKEVDQKIAGIRDFADIGDFFDRPVKMYSSGMYVRLAFSFATSVDPDVLIIDEALSVGDVYFQQKCLQRIQEFKKTGVTILFVSHDLPAVKKLCDRCTLLSQGKIVHTGTPLECLDLYNALLPSFFKESAKQIADVHQGRLHKDSFESGNRKLEVTQVDMLNSDLEPTAVFLSGEKAMIRLQVKTAAQDIQNPTFGILIRDRLGYDIFGTNTRLLGIDTGSPQLGHNFEVSYGIDMNLGPGDYTLTISLHMGETHLEENFHWIDRAFAFKVVLSDKRFIGVSRLNPEFSISYERPE
jgi:lipopolysaccharide transport system ATP-binding protein